MLTLATLVLLALAAPPARGPVHVGFVGDVSFAGRGDDPAEVFAGVRSILDGPDLTVGNVEGLLLAAGAPRYGEARLDISAHPRWAEALARSGIDLFGTANNHAWDAGAHGVLGHLEALAGIATFGSGPTAEQAFAPVRRQTAAGCLSFVPATLKSNRARQDGASVAWYGARGERSLAALEALVRSERAAGCAPIVFVHWGREARPFPDGAVIDIGHALADAGAALVVGHHPHVLQGFTWRETPHGEAAIAWSLGNFVFKNRDPDKRRTGLLEATFITSAADRPPTLDALAFIPMTIDARTFRPRPATAAEAAATARALAERSERMRVHVRAAPDRIALHHAGPSVDEAQ